MWLFKFYCKNFTKKDLFDTLVAYQSFDMWFWLIIIILVAYMSRCRVYIFSGCYKLSDWRFFARAGYVQSSICSETTKYFWHKCHGLFVNPPVMITVKSYLKCRSIHKILLLFKPVSRIMPAHYNQVICWCYKNMPQNLFACLVLICNK